jgi:hypothetical protein
MYENITRDEYDTMTEEKNIALVIIFSIITCGIYNLFWIYHMVKAETAFLESEKSVPGVFFCNILVPFYSWYWLYDRSKSVAMRADKIGMRGISDNSVLYLLLSIFGFMFVSQLLFQNDLNIIARQIKEANDNDHTPSAPQTPHTTYTAPAASAEEKKNNADDIIDVPESNIRPAAEKTEENDNKDIHDLL